MYISLSAICSKISQCKAKDTGKYLNNMDFKVKIFEKSIYWREDFFMHFSNLKYFSGWIQTSAKDDINVNEAINMLLRRVSNNLQITICTQVLKLNYPRC